MPKRTSLISFLLIAGLWGVAQPVHGQALVPHVLQLDKEQLEQQGLGLAQEAAQLAQFQQYDVALTRAQLASQLLPDNADVWALLGSLYLQLDQPEPGIQALLKARSLDRTNAPVLFALGSAYFQQEDYNSAIQYLQAGLRLEPDTPGAWFDLGNAYYKMERYDDAIDQYKKAIDVDAKFWPAINNIGIVLYERGDDDAALEQWRKAVAIDDKQAEPQLAIAIALYKQGKTAEALSQGEAALRIDSRYADLDFLRENLWGDQLLEDARTFLAQPEIREALAQLGDTETAPSPEAAPQ